VTVPSSALCLCFGWPEAEAFAERLAAGEVIDTELYVTDAASSKMDITRALTRLA
jgi:hypothetical protein